MISTPSRASVDPYTIEFKILAIWKAISQIILAYALSVIVLDILFILVDYTLSNSLRQPCSPVL